LGYKGPRQGGGCSGPEKGEETTFFGNQKLDGSKALAGAPKKEVGAKDNRNNEKKWPALNRGAGSQRGGGEDRPKEWGKNGEGTEGSSLQKKNERAHLIELGKTAASVERSNCKPPVHGGRWHRAAEDYTWGTKGKETQKNFNHRRQYTLHSQTKSQITHQKRKNLCNEAPSKRPKKNVARLTESISRR